MKICLIKQSCGLGDIFFCQKIGRVFFNKGYHIVWPIKNEFYYLSKYLDSPFNFPVESIDFPHKELYNQKISDAMVTQDKNIIILPLAGHMPVDPSVMLTKYKFVNIDYSDWANYFNFKRDRHRESTLYYDILGLKEGEKYNLVNNNFVSPPFSEKSTVKIPDNGYRNVFMDYYGIDNIFDWCGVIEGAEEIHTVNTSICYMIEKLNTSDKLYMYHRRPTDTNFDYIKGIYNKKWEYINNGRH